MVDLELSDELRDNALKQIGELWTEHDRLFFDALDESEKKRIRLHFDVDVDMAEAAIVVTELSFADKAVEKGMRVSKVYHSQALRREVSDPKQPRLGMEDPGRPLQTQAVAPPKPRGRKPRAK